MRIGTVCATDELRRAVSRSNRRRLPISCARPSLPNAQGCSGSASAWRVRGSVSNSAANFVASTSSASGRFRTVARSPRWCAMFSIQKRERIANLLTWYTNREYLDGQERQDERFEPRIATQKLILPNGDVHDCRVIDVSLSGASVATRVKPPLNSVVVLGRLRRAPPRPRRRNSVRRNSRPPTASLGPSARLTLD